MPASTAYIAGVYEHPTREATDTSTEQLHAEVARGALEDARLSKNDVDGYYTSGYPEYTYAMSTILMADYLGLDVSSMDSTEVGGSSPIDHVGHAADAIAQGKCDVALVTWAGRPRSSEQDTGTEVKEISSPQHSHERIYGLTNLGNYALAAQRHMHEYGTTSEQLAEIRVAASEHAQYNEDATYQDPVTVEDVVSSKQLADPLHLLDCCIISDGGGAVVVVSEDVAADLDRAVVPVEGHSEAVGHLDAGRIPLTETAGVESGTRAFQQAGIDPDDVDYVGIYDSFTITVLLALEDLGFCEKGEGGEFVEEGTLQAPDGDLPFNTDGGGLCSNHPGNRGGVTKIIESVRQLRGEANPEVQLDNPETAVVHGTGGRIGTRHVCVTMVLGGAQ